MGVLVIHKKMIKSVWQVWNHEREKRNIYRVCRRAWNSCPSLLNLLKAKFQNAKTDLSRPSELPVKYNFSYS